MKTMKYKLKSILSIALAAVMALSLAACGQKQSGTVAISGESLNVGDTALRSDGEAGKIYENGGAKLLVPLEYDALVNVTVPVDGGNDGVLFSVSEKASVEAAEKQGYGDDGYGELFAIGRITKDDWNERRCYDIPGEEVFAEDADGNCYLFYHPTDVRFYRETTEQMTTDQAQWDELNAWAWDRVRESFLAENDGLTALSYGNSILDLDLVRAAYLPGTHYTIATLEHGAVEPEGSESTASYVERLSRNAELIVAHESETPDGEYVVLNFPDDDRRYDFFLASGGENYVRVVWDGGQSEQLYKMVFTDDTTKASEVVMEWYNTLIEKNDASVAVVSTNGITKEMAYEGVSNYCHSTYDWSIAKDSPDVMCVEMGEETETGYRVIFRSYTGAFVYFDVDKATGTAKMTEYAPAVDVEEEAGTINLFDYLNG
jgi:hypothetical protein